MRIYKCILTTLIIILFTLFLMSYIYKSYSFYAISDIVSIIFFVILFYYFSDRKIKIFQFLMGNFTLNDSIQINERIYGKRGKNELWIFNQYRSLTVLFICIIFTVVNLISLNSLIVSGLSLISVGAALGILTFNYSKAIENDNEGIIFSSAKRFYMAAIFAIFLLITIIILKVFHIATPDTLFISNMSFIVAYLINFIIAVASIISSFFLTNSLRFIIEGLILTINETITLHK